MKFFFLRSKIIILVKEQEEKIKEVQAEEVPIVPIINDPIIKFTPPTLPPELTGIPVQWQKLLHADDISKDIETKFGPTIKPCDPSLASNPIADSNIRDGTELYEKLQGHSFHLKRGALPHKRSLCNFTATAHSASGGGEKRGKLDTDLRSSIKKTKNKRGKNKTKKTFKSITSRNIKTSQDAQHHQVTSKETSTMGKTSKEADGSVQHTPTVNSMVTQIAKNFSISMNNKNNNSNVSEFKSLVQDMMGYYKQLDELKENDNQATNENSKRSQVQAEPNSK